jgi:hypothetical protein
LETEIDGQTKDARRGRGRPPMRQHGHFGR